MGSDTQSTRRYPAPTRRPTAYAETVTSSRRFPDPAPLEAPWEVEAELSAGTQRRHGWLQDGAGVRIGSRVRIEGEDGLWTVNRIFGRRQVMTVFSEEDVRSATRDAELWRWTDPEPGETACDATESADIDRISPDDGQH